MGEKRREKKREDDVGVATTKKKKRVGDYNNFRQRCNEVVQEADKRVKKRRRLTEKTKGVLGGWFEFLFRS